MSKQVFSEAQKEGLEHFDDEASAKTLGANTMI